MKKKIKKDNKEKMFRSGEVMTMLEQINDGIKIIGEQHGEIVVRLDKVDSRLDTMQDDITEIKYRLSEKVDKAEFEKMEKRVTKLEKLVFAKLA